MNSIPRREIGELIVRRKLSNLYTIVVEGATDKRFLELVQREEYSSDSFRHVDVFSIDSFEVTNEMLAKHGILTNGARQRVVAFSHEVAQHPESAGMRAIIDLDLDSFLGKNLQHATLMYTDFGCMDAYLWTEDVTKSVAIHFKCDSAVKSAKRIKDIYGSIGVVCRTIAAVRAVQALNSGFGLKTHESDNSLSLRDFSVQLDLSKYIDATKPRRKDREKIVELVNANIEKLNEIDPLMVLNGHDLVWVLSFTLKKLTEGKRYLVNSDGVAASLVSHGIRRNDLIKLPLFVSLEAWSGA